MTKECDVCGSEFEARAHNAQRCSDKCKREAVLAYQREYREANKEAIAERKRKWHEDNREARLAKLREYREAKKEVLAAKQRKYRKTPAGKAAEKRKEAKRRGAPCNGTVKHFQLADKCVRCGSTESLELEHITPISQGGSNHIENLTTMCAECNHGVGGKRTKGPHDWATFVAWYLWNE